MAEFASFEPILQLFPNPVTLEILENRQKTMPEYTDFTSYIVSQRSTQYYQQIPKKQI